MSEEIIKNKDEIIECCDCIHRRQVEDIMPFCGLIKNNKREYRYCHVERVTGECGIDGVNFEPKE